MQAASVSSPDAARLADVLAKALCTWEQHRGDDGVFTMALPLQGVDPLQQLPLLQAPHPFRFLWDGSPGLSLAASGRCHHLDLAGPKRFELAQRFSDATLARLIDASPSARPRPAAAYWWPLPSSPMPRSNSPSPSMPSRRCRRCCRAGS